VPADFSQYIDLRIFDKNPGDIYRDSLAVARLTLPDFNFRVGTPEDAMFQAAAYISSLSIATINRIPSRLMAGLVSILGFTRNQGTPAEVDITITLSTYDGGVIPSGTAFVYSTTFAGEFVEYVFQTTESITIDAVDLEETLDYPSATVTVECINVGLVPPIIAGETMAVISSGTDIAYVVVSTPANFVNGTEPDTDGEYLSGATAYLQSLSSCLTTPNQVDSFLLTTYPNIVGRSKTYDLTNGDDLDGDITTKRTTGCIYTYLDSNIATITTESPHLYIVGDVVSFETFNASVSATFDGEHQITATTDTTFSFLKTASNSASTNVSASAYAGGDIGGYTTIFAYGINRFLTTSEKTDLLSEVSSRVQAGIQCTIVDPTLVTLEISGDVSVLDTYSLASVQDSIESALISYLNPASFSLNEDRIRYNTLLSLINSIDGVAYVTSLSLTPTGSDWLPQHGNDLLFLNKGTLPILSADDIDIQYTVVSV